MTIGKSKIIAISVFLISSLAFFAGFLFNAWNVLENDKFLDPQAESLLVGRLVKSRTDGIFSAGGLCGRCNDNPKDSTGLQKNTSGFDYQYQAFEYDIPCRKFSPYLSQIGFHAVIYSLIDMASPFSSPVNLTLLRAFKSGTLAAMMGLIVLWFYLETGLLAAIFVFLGVLLTPWFTYLGRDLWFCVWTNFLPFMVALFLLRKEYSDKKPSEFLILLYVNLAILANFVINGYEWVSTTLIMATVPFFYYWRKGQWPFKKLARRMLWLIAGSLASLLITFTVLVYQISLVKGTFSDGIDWIIFSFLKRSHGSADLLPEVYAKQVDHSLPDVFLRYFSGPAFRFPEFMTRNLPWYLGQVFFAELVAAFILATFLAVYRKNLLRLTDASRKILVDLSVATWISILAPFSWYVIFKGHAWSHYHINYITWFMPFCLFGLALAGATIKSLFEKRVKKGDFVT